MKRKCMNTVLKLCFIGGMCFPLIGCEKERSGVTLESETTTIIGKNDVTEIKEVEKTNVELRHIEKINENEVVFKPNYAIEKSRAENWFFTQSSSIDLGLNIEAVPSGFNVMVSQIYADISLLSPYAEYNGIRQDSINIEYFSLPNGGISINEENGFNVPFQIEAVDKSETFFLMWYGSGSSYTGRITESDIAKEAKGAVLNVVWTILFENKETGEQFVKTINDRVGIPYNRSDSEEETN